jgi:hypothetical protein
MMLSNIILASVFFSLKKLPPYTPAGFDLTKHNSAGIEDNIRPHSRGFSSNFLANPIEVSCL